jgi:hypothetical protein
MQKLEKLLERIIRRVNINLRGQDFDAGPFLRPCAFASFLSLCLLKSPGGYHFIQRLAGELQANASGRVCSLPDDVRTTQSRGDDPTSAASG